MNKNRKLIIAKPFGGIANRLRVISSMLWVKQKFDVELKIIWIANSELNASYCDLFQSHPEFEVIETLGKYKYIKTSKQKNSLKRLTATIFNKSIGVDYCVFDSDIHMGYEKVIKIIESNNVIFFNTCEELYIYDNGLRSIKLKFPIEDRLSELIKNLSINEHTIGIHIRRTDHSISIDSSPLYLFENAITEELSRNPSSKFYLASDDPQVILHFTSKFGEIVLFIEKKYGRNTKEAIIDGLLELFLLSKTKKIYGSYWSSYSKIAARLSGIEIETLSIRND